MNTKKFTNADSLIEYCINNNLLAGQVWVDHNPYKRGERTLLWYSIYHDKELSTHIYMQYDVKGGDYSFRGSWHEDYTGSFELVLPFTQFTKPEVYAVGDWVEVLENAKGVVDGYLAELEIIGKKYQITNVCDTYDGISYTLSPETYQYNWLPHYCVRKVEQPPREMTLADMEQALGYKIKLIN